MILLPTLLRLRRGAGLVLASAVLSACTGLGASRADTDFSGSGVAPMERGTLASARQLSSPSSVAQSAPQPGRTVIRNGTLGVAVPEVDRAMREAERIAAAAGGSVARSSKQDATGSMTLRIPDAQLDRALDSLASLGKVTQRGISAEDVTAQVIDLDARIKALETSRDRLRALHERTNTVEEIVAVERELARVTGELDSLQGRLRDLRGRADLSIVHLSLTKRQVLGPLGVVFYGLGRLVGKLFIIS